MALRLAKGPASLRGHDVTPESPENPQAGPEEEPREEPISSPAAAASPSGKTVYPIPLEGPGFPAAEPDGWGAPLVVFRTILDPGARDHSAEPAGVSDGALKPAYHRDADPAVIGPALAREVRRALSDIVVPDSSTSGSNLYDSPQYMQDELIYFGLSIQEWTCLGLIWCFWLYCLISDIDMSRATDPDLLVAAANAVMPPKEYLKYLLRFAFWAAMYRTALSVVYIPVLAMRADGLLPSIKIRKLIGGITFILVFMIVGLIAVIFGLEDLVIG